MRRTNAVLNDRLKIVPIYVSPSMCVCLQVGNARVLIPTTGIVDAEVLTAAPHCKLIAQPAAGTANIDKEAAQRRGIPVTYAPGERGWGADRENCTA